MEWLGYAAAFNAGLLFAVSDVLVRVSSRRLPPRVMLAVSVIVGLPVLAAAAIASRAPPPGVREAALYAVAGLLNFVVGRLLFYYAVAGAGATTASIVTSPTVLLSAILAWAVLGEPLSPELLAGLAMVVAGVLLASVEPSGDPLQGVGSRLGVLAGAASSLVFASTSVIVRAAGLQGGHPAWGVTISYAAALPFVVALAARAAGGLIRVLPLGDPVFRAAAGAAVAVALAQLSRYLSLHLLPVAYAVVLISLFPVHTAVLSMALSGRARENVRRRHVAGALLAFTGVAVALLY